MLVKRLKDLCDGEEVFTRNSCFCVDKKFNWASYEALKSMKLKGEYMTISGPWVGPDETYLNNVIEYFQQATGAIVNYTGSDSFEQRIIFDVKAGIPPNIAIFPQPGLAADLAAKNYLSPLGEENKKWLIDNYSAGQSWADLGTYKNKEGKDELFGFPFKASLTKQWNNSKP